MAEPHWRNTPAHLDPLGRDTYYPPANERRFRIRIEAETRGFAIDGHLLPDHEPTEIMVYESGLKKAQELVEPAYSAEHAHMIEECRRALDNKYLRFVTQQLNALSLDQWWDPTATDDGSRWTRPDLQWTPPQYGVRREALKPEQLAIIERAGRQFPGSIPATFRELHNRGPRPVRSIEVLEELAPPPAADPSRQRQEEFKTMALELTPAIFEEREKREQERREAERREAAKRGKS